MQFRDVRKISSAAVHFNKAIYDIEALTPSQRMYLQTLHDKDIATTVHEIEQYRRFPESSICCKKSSAECFHEVLMDVPDLTNLQKAILRERYIRVLHNFQKRCKRYSFIYYVGHFFITVGSLIVPALMSVQYTDVGMIASNFSSFQSQIYWTTWVISLLVTTFNGILILFKIDKKYFFLHTTMERLRSEGWQYLELTGRYSGQLIHYEMPVTHKNQFIYFCHMIEKIKMKQVEEEYYKQEDKQKTQVGAANPSSSSDIQQSSAHSTSTQQNDSIYPPSPDVPLDKLTKIPSTVKDVVNSLVVSSSFRVTPPKNRVIIPETDTVGSEYAQSNQDSRNGSVRADDVNLPEKSNSQKMYDEP